MNTPHSRRPASPPQQALTEADIDTLQSLLDALPEPLEPLDASMVDGYLCGVLLQPQRIPESRWMPHVTDVEGRALPTQTDVTRLHMLVRRRHAELDAAIQNRQWFDPWVFELDDADDEAPATPSQTVYPWVAGFATAVEVFPALMREKEPLLTEPLALLYRHLDPDDLEDADALLEEIETLEPPERLEEAVEDLVRATLLIADVSRPVAASAGARRAAQRRPPRPRR
jgi:uncharacterized protein